MEEQRKSENALVPALRFEGFSDPWEQRRLGEVVDVRSGRDYKHLKPGLIPVYGTGGLMTYVNEALSKNEDAIGIGRKGTIDQPYKLYAPFWTVDTLFYAIPKIGIDIEFALSCFLRINWKAKDESTGLPSLSKSAINDTRILLPDAREQSRIGTLFSKLDSLIALHQRKHEKLKTVKQSLLEKMFPKEGEDVPEIRFEGFTDPWEQRRLGEVVDVRSGRDYKHLKPGLIPVYGTGGLMTYVNEALSKNEDAIGIGRKGTIDQPYKLYAPFWTVDTLFYAIPKIGIDIEFALSCFLRINWKAKDESTGLPSLSKSAINDTRILLPDAREQSRIGTLFSKLDSLIALHQRELDILKNLKQALLEKMFV